MSDILAILAAEEDDDELRLRYQQARSVVIPQMPVVPPEFVSAEIGNVDASTVAVTFDQNITASNYATGVTIKVNTVAATISSATRQTDHAVVYYVLDTPAVAGDDVTWEYTGGNITAEDDGAALGTVTAQTVTNNIVGDEMLSATVTLTDTQIKSLVGTPVQIIAAPGSGKMIMPISAVMVGHQTAAYTNVDPDAYFQFLLSGFDIFRIANASPFLTFGADSILPASSANEGSGTAGVEAPSEFENKPLMLYLGTNSGEAQGGNPANTIDVTVLYAIVDI